MIMTAARCFLCAALSTCLLAANGFVRASVKVPPSHHQKKIDVNPLHVAVTGAEAASKVPFLTNTTEPLVGAPAVVAAGEYGTLWKRRVSLESVRARLAEWMAEYMRLLKERPIITKAVSAAIVQAIGDMISQPLFARLESRTLVYDFSRTFCFMLTGFVYKAPMLHTWYSLMARMGKSLQRRYKLSDNQRVAAELAVDQSIGVFIYYPLCFYAYELCTAVAYLRVPDFASITAGGAGKILTAIKAQYGLWPLSQLISFRFVPERLRVMHTMVVSILWNIFFCALVARR